MLLKLIALPVVTAIVLSAAPILFFGLDPEGTGFTNGLNARAQFLASVNSLGTENFEQACGPCEPTDLFFNASLTGTMCCFPPGTPVRQALGFPGGSTRAFLAENRWAINLSSPVGALGFYAANLLYEDFLGETSSLQLILGNLPPIVIDMAPYGLARRTHFSAFVGFIDSNQAYSRVEFANMVFDLTNSFSTDLVTAGEPVAPVPESSTGSSLAVALLLFAWWRREACSNRR